MSAKKYNVSLFDLTMCFSDAMDLISPVVVDHHKKVALIADYLGEEINLPPEKQMATILSGLLHDSGAISLKERINALQFELETPHQHSEMGYLLLNDFPHYKNIAAIIRYHHASYEETKGDPKIPIESHIIHLADRISVLIKSNEPVLTQKQNVVDKINAKKGKLFDPEIVEVFENISEKESFWLDISSHKINELLASRAEQTSEIVNLDINGLLDIGRLFKRVIDFRSAFTSTHSSGVAASAEAIARQIGFSNLEQLEMRLAGFLHDLGKLAVPKEILEKPGKLTSEEYRVIKTHTYHTYRTLERIPELNTVKEWGAYHHEKLNGKGYPFRCSKDELTLGSRIMAVADVFTALTEERPYREGLGKEKVRDIISEMVEGKALDSGVVEILFNNFQEINELRAEAQDLSRQEYHDLPAVYGN